MTATSFDALNTAREQKQSSGRVLNATQNVASRNMPDDQQFRQRLAARVMGFVKLSDEGEELRRRADRIGGNLYYSRHWQVAVPRNRAAMTVNITKTLVDQSVSIMTKQEPVWVVMPDDVGDVQSSRLMRSILMRQWKEDNMMRKSRQALKLAKCTRTVGAKTLWDPTMKGGVGDVTTDIIPGWRMILDPRTANTERMEFIGDRALMSRVRAMLLYPEVAETFVDAGQTSSNAITGGGSSATPVEGPWRGFPVDSPTTSGGVIINGKPVVTAYTSRSPATGSSEYECEVLEIYYRDRTLVKRMVAKKDERGQVIQRIKLSEDGAPLFTQDGEHDEILGEPGFQLVYEDVEEERLVPKYPQWRRTTLLAPDGMVLDDRAWDKPQPYSLYADNEALEGPWGKGTALEAEELQACLNVSMSTMMDNLRFSAYRAFKASAQAQIERNNLVISPGDIIRVGTDVSNFVPLEFPEVSQAWFGWVNLVISLMERVFGLEGIMQGKGTDAPRTDSAKGFDSLAEIGGSRVVEQTQRFERWLSEIGQKVCWWAQREYTEEHAIAVENLEGELTYQRADRSQLAGTFSCNVQIGSTLAWSASAVRDRVLSDYQSGLRDKVSVWQEPAMMIADWQLIKEREKTQPPAMGSAPPPRTRQHIPSPPKPREGKSGQYK